MELTCYVLPGWEPLLRPAPARRDWMDQAAESFAYRCLPLSIANSYGWELLTPHGFSAVWNGGPGPQDVRVQPDPGTQDFQTPLSHFGMGTVTVHVEGLFRTAPGWNLWVGGPPNRFKDGAAPLCGIIESDWAPYTFTVNWRLTRPGLVVRFEAREPVAHIFPIPRAAIETVTPAITPLEDNPQLKADFEAWSRSRTEFQAHLREHPAEKPADRWQKAYYRGLMPDGGRCPIEDHQTKLQVKPFSGEG